MHDILWFMKLQKLLQVHFMNSIVYVLPYFWRDWYRIFYSYGIMLFYCMIHGKRRIILSVLYVCHRLNKIINNPRFSLAS